MEIICSFIYACSFLFSKRNLKTFLKRNQFAHGSTFGYAFGMELNKEIDKDELKEWGEVMLQHSFDQDEWIEARITLLNLLSSDQKVAKESAIRSYLSCCAEAVGTTHPLPSLKDSLIELYQQYGMEESSERLG